MSDRITTFSFNLKAHVMQYNGNKPETGAFITQHLVAPNVVSDGKGSDLKVKYESAEAGDRVLTIKQGMYVVVLFDRVHVLQQEQFGRFMATCS